MAKFYFTYALASSTQAFVGGWTEVEAEDEEQARCIFGLAHKSKSGYLPCAGIYDEESFRKTQMARRGENYGLGCVEKISLKVDILERNAMVIRR